jgi:hypothetical protein
MRCQHVDDDLQCRMDATRRVLIVGGDPPDPDQSGFAGTVYMVPGLQAARPRPEPVYAAPEAVPISSDRPASQRVNDREPVQDRPHHRDRRALGVSKQRAHQLADEDGFPAPVELEGQSRVWDRREVQAWAKRWRSEKPWR